MPDYQLPAGPSKNWPKATAFWMGVGFNRHMFPPILHLKMRLTCSFRVAFNYQNIADDLNDIIILTDKYYMN